MPAQPGTRIRLLAFLLAAIAFAGCTKRREVCPRDLSGTWFHPGDEVSRYVIADHGQQVDVSPSVVDGGTLPDRRDVLPSPLRMQRKDGALQGTMMTTAQSTSGKKCPVEAQVEIVLCDPREVTVQIEQVPVGEDCKRLDLAPGGNIYGHRLLEMTLMPVR